MFYIFNDNIGNFFFLNLAHSKIRQREKAYMRHFFRHFHIEIIIGSGIFKEIFKVVISRFYIAVFKAFKSYVIEGKRAVIADRNLSWSFLRKV